MSIAEVEQQQNVWLADFGWFDLCSKISIYFPRMDVLNSLLGFLKDFSPTNRYFFGSNYKYKQNLYGSNEPSLWIQKYTADVSVAFSSKDIAGDIKPVTGIEL
jgi:hypothetical protein